MIKDVVKRLAGSFGYEISRKPSSQSRKCWPPQHVQAQTGYEEDEWFHSLFDHATGKTQMERTDNALRRQRHFTLNHLVRNALQNLEGDVCEAGCWRGMSTYQIASRIRDSKKDLTLHVFDSFQGLSEYKDEDKVPGMELPYEDLRQKFACSLETVMSNLSEFDFIKFYQGWIPERFSDVSDGRFSFVHVDVDMYHPILDCIDFFYPRLVNRGIMVFDDYGAQGYPGAAQAIDEKLIELGNPFFIPLPSGQAFLVKSGD